MSTQDLASLVARLEKVADRLERGGSGAGAGASSALQADSKFLEPFQELKAGPLAKYLAASQAVGTDVAAHSQLVSQGFDQLDALLHVAAASKAPAPSALPEVLKPLSAALTNVVEFRDQNRKSANFNHLSAVSEGIPFLGWVSISPKPVPYIEETINSAEFYSNRVIKDFKDKDQKHVDWARSWIALIKAVAEYVRDYHTTGLAWNSKGGEAKAPAGGAAAAAAAPKPAAAAAAPAATAAPAAAASGPAGDLKGGLFAQLSKGADVTSGLKKVDKSQMTHKNPELRATSVVPAAAFEAKKPAAPAAAAAKQEVKPPVLELQGKKWVIEHHVGNQTIVLDDTNTKQSVYIYKCTNSVITIKGKVNQISMDSCKKTAVVFDAVVASFEAVNSQSIQVQVLGVCPLVSIDKTDGAQVYLSKDSLETEIVSAKSSEMNVSVPKNDQGDFIESPLPEMMKSKFKNGKMHTEIVEHSG